MPALTSKNIPADLYERLKQSGVRHRRSVNSEVIVAVERTLQNRPVLTEFQSATISLDDFGS